MVQRGAGVDSDDKDDDIPTVDAVWADEVYDEADGEESHSERGI